MMNLKYIPQMIRPKIAGPVMWIGELPPGLPSSKIGAPKPTSRRTTKAIRTGAATTKAMKMVRRDHSISPSDRSNTRKLEATNPGAARGGKDGWFVISPGLSLHQVLENGLQVVVRRRVLVDRAELAGRGNLGQPRV